MFDEMCALMVDFCRHYDDLSVEERSLLSCAYKNVVGARRRARANLQLLLLASLSKPGPQPHNMRLIQRYMGRLEGELRAHCEDIIGLLVKRLIPANSASGESRIFYYKLKGDYARYLCEISQSLERKERLNESLMAYKSASERALIELPPTHPVRLGLMLNFSVFYRDIMGSLDRACRMAKQAFDDAIAELDTLSEETYFDATTIMQLLRDNINLWESEQAQLLEAAAEVGPAASSVSCQPQAQAQAQAQAQGLAQAQTQAQSKPQAQLQAQAQPQAQPQPPAPKPG